MKRSIEELRNYLAYELAQFPESLFDEKDM